MVQAFQELAQVHPPADTVLTVGVFDGVHRGHRHLIQQVRQEALRRGLLAGVVTFRNHPRQVLRPDTPLVLLTTLEERLRLLEAQGVDLVVPLTFDLELSQVRARQFCAELQERMRMRALVVGPTFAMGFRREGTPPVLQQLGEEMGFAVRVVEPLMEAEEMVSSSVLRRTIQEGNVAKANHYLGHPFALEGMVVQGDRRGRALGFPTANLEVAPGLAVPGDGVYATWASVEGDGRWKAATSIGVRPTFGGNQRTIEAFLIGYQGDLYQHRLRLEFTHRLRDELRFESVEALVRQMREDVRQAEELLEDTPRARD